MLNNWADANILITGGTSGIGAALARAFVGLGAQVGITGRDPARVEQKRAEIGAAWAFAGDLSRRADRDALIAAVRDRGVGIDLLVNNAGVMLEPDLLDGGASLDRLDEKIGLNLVAPIELSVALLPLLRKSARAAIVMVTSGYALTPSDRGPTYSAAKAGLHSFTKSLRRAAAPLGVHVLELLPPRVDTPATAKATGAKLSSDAVAAVTIAGLERRKAQVLPGQARFLPTMLRVFPGMIERMIARS